MKPETLEDLILKVSTVEREIFELYQVCKMGKTKLEIVCEACNEKVSLTLLGLPARCWCPSCNRSLIIDEVKENTTEGFQSGFVVYSFPDYVLNQLGKTLDEIFAEYKAGRIQFAGDPRGIQFVEEP